MSLQNDRLFEDCPHGHILQVGDRMRRTNQESASSVEWFSIPTGDLGQRADYFGHRDGFEVQRRRILYLRVGLIVQRKSTKAVYRLVSKNYRLNSYITAPLEGVGNRPVGQCTITRKADFILRNFEHLALEENEVLPYDIVRKRRK